MNFPWYLSRSAGMVAYLILFLTVVLGISIRTRGLDRYLARWKVTDLHIFLSLLALGFVAVHAGVLLWDGFVGYSLLDLIVPFATGYRTFWTGIGIVTLYLLVVVAISFPTRRWIGYRTWRTLHYSTFLAYLGALGHGIFTGTDSRVAWAQALYVVSAAVVLGLVLYRIYAWRRREQDRLGPALNVAKGRRPPAEALSTARRAAARLRVVENRSTGIVFAASLLTATVFLAAGLGPFRWFGRDDASVDAPEAALATGADPSAPLASAQPTGFSDTFAGSSTQTQDGSTVKISLVANGTGERNVAVDVELQLAQSGRRTTATSNSIQLKDGAGSPLCAGEVQSLTQSALEAICDGQGAFAGRRITLEMLFDSGFGSRVSGTLSATLG